MTGRSLPHAILMMIPEPWQNHESMSPERRAFYEYHASLMEPWDGPASIAFTDGTVIGAVLDRNGLRPSRYYVTKDGLVVMASEVGVLDIPPENIALKERLHPGRIFLVDTAPGPDHRRRGDQDASWRPSIPTASGCADNIVRIDDLPGPPGAGARPRDACSRARSPSATRTRTCASCSAPMAKNGEEPIGSMGTDTALAVLSDRPRLLYDYFKQLFAQVTNPPLDPIREELVTSMESTIGPEGNLLEAGAGVVPPDRHPGPGPHQRGARQAPPRRSTRGSRSATLPMLYPVAEGAAGLAARARRAARAGQRGDRRRPQHPDPLRPRRHAASTRRSRACSPPRPCTTTWSARGKRTRCGLVIETGDAREVHHMCLLIGYGAGAVNP